MPTPNHDSCAIVVNTAWKRGSRILTVLTILAAMALAPGSASAANNCVMVTLLPPATTNWSDTSRWLLCGGGYPGQSGSGDTASILSLLGTTINVDVPINSVKLLIDGSIPVQIPSGVTLTLESSSTATSNNTFTVAAGGTIGTASGASITGFQGSVVVNGGTFNSLGSIQLSSPFIFNGGSLTGSGTVSAGSAQFTGSIGAMAISNTTFDDSGSLSYTAGANALTLSSGASINVQSGATFNVQTDAAINGTATESINIASGGAMHKTSGTAVNAISCFVKNDGTVNASTGGTGGFKFSGGGTHSGSFITGSSQPIVFASDNTFNSGAAFSGGTPIEIDSGTQTFNASINAGDGLKWAGGTIAGTGPLNVSNSMLFAGSLSAMTLTGVMKSTATITYAPTVINNLLTINGASAVFETTTPGSLSIAGDYDILASPAGAGTLHISGTANVNKTSGSAGSSIQAYVDNQGSTLASSASRPLNLAGGGQSTGTVSVPNAGNSINFTGGTFASSGAFSGSGTVKVAGGTLNVNTATTFSGSPSLGISSGTLGGTGAVTLTGTTTWSGGTITGSNPFTINSPGAMTLTGANGAMTLDGRTLTNNSQLTFNATANSLTLTNAASISNTATFTISSAGGTIASDGTATAVTNTSTGSMAKTSASGIFSIYPSFNHAGSVNLTGGVIDVLGAGTSSGSFTMAAGTEVWFPTPFSSTYTWASGTTFSGGKVTVDGSGTVATSAALTINNTNLVINGGTFSTPSTLTITSPATLKWTGGTLSGAGHTVISSGTTFDMTSEFSPRSVSSHTIDNGGNATLSAIAQPPSLDSGSTFNNISTGTLDIQSDGSMNTNGTGTNTFSNAGVVKKSAGGSGFRFDVPYNQTGGSTDASSASSGSTIIFNAGGSMTFGILKATQASNFVDFFNGSFSVSGGSFAGPGALRLNGGILNINTLFTFPSLFDETAGSLGGVSAITIPSAATFNWSGGSITGGISSPITIMSGGAMNADTTTSSLIYNARPLVINAGGNFNWNSGANAIDFEAGSNVANAGTFTVATVGGTLGNATGSFLNTGLFRHTGAGTLNITLPLTNSGGTVSEQASVLVFLDTTSVTHTGTFDAQPGTFFDFGAGTHNLSAGFTFTGTGTFKIAGATLNANTNVSVANLILLAGTIGGTGNVTTTSSFTWSGGSMSGTGTTIVSAGTAQFNTNSLSLGRNLTLSVDTTFNDANSMNILGGLTITNNATFDIQAIGGLFCTCGLPSTFINNGILRKSGPAVPVQINTRISGTGSLDVTGGWLQLLGNSSFASASIASGSIAQFSGAVNSIGGTVSGLGTLLIIGGSTTVTGAVSLASPGWIEIQSGTLTLNGATTTEMLLLRGGSTTGAGSITANDLAWLGGSLAGTGSLTVANTFGIQGGYGPMTLARNLINNAPSGIYDPPNATNILSVAPGVTITNNGGLEIQSGIAALAGNPAPSFVNTGVLYRGTGTPGTVAFDPVLINTGIASFMFGTTNFTNGFTQTAGVTTFVSPISSPVGFMFNGGAVNGASTLTGDVTNAGSASLTPGNISVPGLFSIIGNYTQTSGGTLTTRINGTTAGTGYGQLSVTGNVSLAGALTVVNPLGYTPNNGDTYNVVTFTGTRTNDFDTKNFPSPGAGGFLQASYVSGPPAALAVTAAMQPADISATQAGPAAVSQGQNATIVITVANAGPGPAANVVLNDTFSDGTLVSATPSSGLCSGAGPVNCSLGTISGSSNATVTLVINASAVGTITNNASASTTTSESNLGNNTAPPLSIAVTASADLSITKNGPASATAGFPFVYTITVTNNGPSDASAVVVSDPTPAGTTFVSNSGGCTTAFPCTLGTLTAGQSKTITSTFTTPPTFTGTSIANTASVTSTTSDPSAGNNSATATTPFGPPNADLLLVKTGPASATPGSTITYTLTIINNGPATAINVNVADPTPAGLSFISNSGACSSPFPCSLGNLTSNQSATITATYTVTATSGPVTNTATVSSSSTDPSSGNNASSVTTQIGTNACGAQPPALVSPANGSTVTSPVTFSWTAVPGASSYKLFAAVDGGSTQEIGNTSGTSLTLPISGGTLVWSVQALGIQNCNQLQSANGTFNICGAAPLLSVVGTSSAGQSYTVQWTDSGVANYELQEAATAGFDSPQTFQVAGTSKTFTKDAVTPTAFFYRVRALATCGQGPGPYSATERVVIVPVPPINAQGPSSTVDINNKHVVVQTVFVPGQGSAIPFTAITDEPWLTVSPNSGILPAAGITLTVSADPADLPNGTFTATIIISFPVGGGKIGTLGVTPPVTVPVSVSVVTPVSPAPPSGPSANSLIIPSVGHLDGINSQWRSDVRITNTSLQKINYLLRFTPAGGDPSQAKQTQVSIASNDTMALDDIVKNWYGVGALGDAANGVLEIRPLNTAGKGAPNTEDVNVSFVTVASSRTFNQSTGGTLGQYIPAIPFASFIGKVATTGDARAGILSMQQIAQSPSYRTNLGIVEAAGKPASVLLSVFDTSGKNLLDLPIDLKAGEQRQLNSFLSAQNISLADGRVEAKVTDGDGKIMAYASVVDNTTTDPLLVTGVPLAQTPAQSYVLPGVADLGTGGANWRSDLRIFNSGTAPQFVTMTLYPQTGSSSSNTISRSFTVNPGEVSVLDNVLASHFGVTNIGGAMHVDTLTDANLVVTGRTYNQVDGGGTYGQFIAAVTPDDGIAKGGRTLNVLQIEDSTRYRTNLGIAEVSGQPVTVEVSVFLPDAKVAPKVTITLAANEYRQFRVLQQLGVGTAYNARIAIRVIDGDGKITAYGSVIDMQTQDPTYVPAQ
jgi:uncharacterized repeat protein (TIGR01451 family)